VDRERWAVGGGGRLYLRLEARETIADCKLPFVCTWCAPMSPPSVILQCGFGAGAPCGPYRLRCRGHTRWGCP